ncbi:hypothetical protein ACWDA3_55580 [Nonomuraea rubra]
MPVDQLPADAQAAVTRAAVALLKAARAGVDEDTYAELVYAQMIALHRTWCGDDVPAVRMFGALISAQARIGAHLAGLADRNGQAGRYLDELGGLAAHGTE